ncbi:MAG: hypothetical protein ABIF87_00455 [Pseudomonadota bacterium]
MLIPAYAGMTTKGAWWAETRFDPKSDKKHRIFVRRCFLKNQILAKSACFDAATDLPRSSLRALNAAARRMLIAAAFKAAARLTALNPLTRSRLTPVFLSYSELVASI